MPITPVLAVLASLYLMLYLVEATWIRFGVWMAMGVVLYFVYGIRKSATARPYDHLHPSRCTVWPVDVRG
jgi:APA family basic amino acid/polyamine antiporter